MRNAVLVLAFTLLACHNDRAPTSPTAAGCGPVMGALGDVDVTGRVTTADGKPATGALVRFIDSAGFSWSRTADANGTYLFSGSFNHGTYTLYVVPPGESHPVANWQVELRCGDNVRDIVIPTIRCTYISGLVTANYSRVAGALVSFAGTTFVTSSDGSFVLPLGCPPQAAGAASPFTVTHRDYQPYSVTLTVPSASMSLDVKLLPR